ncbi:MAG: type II toxin-antitoxin system RelE/ParE family toxin [Vicinamibacterales bacterium]
MREVLWTKQAQADLAAIRTFIGQDSPHYAAVVVARLVAATDRLVPFPESGRAVQEFDDVLVREVVHRPYRIIYRLVGHNEIHILTVHHSSKEFPAML